MKKVLLTLSVCAATTAFLAHGAFAQGEGDKGKKKGGGGGKASFETMDTDHNGSLSLDEFTKAKEGRDPDKVKAMFKKIDANGDDKISKEEFEAAHAKRGEGKNAKGGAGANQ